MQVEHHHNPVQDRTEFWKSFVVWSRLIGPLGVNAFSFIIVFSILGWSFVFCDKTEVVRPIESAAVFFQTRILKTRTPRVKNTNKLVWWLGMI